MSDRFTGDRPTLGDRLKAWWIDKLDNDSVRGWVPNYCRAWLSWALLATFWLPPISTIQDGMGAGPYVIWVWLGIVGNTLPILGLWMRHGGSSVQDIPDRLLKLDWAGLFAQALGHAIAHIALVMFEIAGVIGALTYDGPAAYAGMTVFAVFMLWPWTKGTALLCAQCLRKVQKAVQRDKQRWSGL